MQGFKDLITGLYRKCSHYCIFWVIIHMAYNPRSDGNVTF